MVLFLETESEYAQLINLLLYKNMIRRLYILTIMQLVCMQGFSRASSPQFAYKDSNLSIDIRVTDLLSRMTLEEKVGQLLCPLGWDMYEIRGNEVFPSDKFKQLIKNKKAGMLWATYRADPWTKKTLANGLNPELAAKAGNALQKYVIENTRLGIPMFLAEEAPHGHMAIGATVFPTGIGMAATWSPDLIKEVGQVIAEEVRSQGGHISYGPVLDLSRDPRWSRVEETFGEDPILSGTLGVAMVEGLTKGDISQKNSTIATLKHFLAYAVPEGGQNGNQALVGVRELHESFLPPFKKAIDAGALSVMTSYNSIDGIPCTANSYLLSQLLRNEWKFRGFVVSDLYSIEGIHESHRTASSVSEAATQAISAGVDIDLGGDAYVNVCQAVREGRLSESVVDTAVYRVLRLKFEMGLFENPYVDPELATKKVRSKENIELARRVAQASVTLLENKHSILPLRKDAPVYFQKEQKAMIEATKGDYMLGLDSVEVIVISFPILTFLISSNKLNLSFINFSRNLCVKTIRYLSFSSFLTIDAPDAKYLLTRLSIRPINSERLTSSILSSASS